MYYLCFVLALIMPVLMFIIGLRWRLKPPAFQASGFVYSTESTRKSPEIWVFAHVHCGKLWTRFGAILAVISAVLMIVFTDSYQKFFLWLLCGQMLVMCVTVFIIDLFTKNLFDENGTRIVH